MRPNRPTLDEIVNERGAVPMPIDKVVAPLLRVPLFADLTPLQVGEIARHAERVKFQAGATIARAGEPGDAAYLIVTGQAECPPNAGSAVPGELVEPGSMVGELAMLVEHIYGTTVVASERVHCLRITRAAMHAQMLADPLLAGHLEAKITQRLLHVAGELRRIDEAIAMSAAAFAPLADALSRSLLASQAAHASSG